MRCGPCASEGLVAGIEKAAHPPRATAYGWRSAAFPQNRLQMHFSAPSSSLSFIPLFSFEVGTTGRVGVGGGAQRGVAGIETARRAAGAVGAGGHVGLRGGGGAAAGAGRHVARRRRRPDRGAPRLARRAGLGDGGSHECVEPQRAAKHAAPAVAVPLVVFCGKRIRSDAPAAPCRRVEDRSARLTPSTSLCGGRKGEAAESARAAVSSGVRA